jgi:hypothetical protein
VGPSLVGRMALVLCGVQPKGGAPPWSVGGWNGHTTPGRKGAVVKIN